MRNLCASLFLAVACCASAAESPLGFRDLVWKDVCIMKSGKRTLEFDCITFGERSFFVQIDGGEKREVRVEPPASGVIAKAKLELHLDKGVHQIRLSNASAWCPDIDRMTIGTVK